MAKVKGSRQENLVVKVHKPGRVWSLVVIGIFFAALGMVVSFYGGRFYEQQLNLLMPAEKMKLEYYLEKSAVMENDRSVDRMALDAARININELEGQVHQLSKEIAFYRSVLAPESSVRGLFVHDLDIEESTGISDPENGAYRLSWVLAQVGKNKNIVSGDVQIKLHAVSDGEKRVLSLKDVTSEMPNTAFKLRYFQAFETEIQLPENVKVEKIEVIATTDGKKPKNVTREFEWAVQGGVQNVSE